MRNQEKAGTRKRRAAVHVLLTLALPAAILLFWEWGVRTGKLNGNVVPPPTKLWKTFISLAVSGKLGQGLLISIRRVLEGFLIAAAAGIAVGFLMGLFAPVNRLLSSVVNILRPIPVIAIIPIFIMILGVGESANIAIIIIGALWPVLLNTVAGVRSVDRKLIEVAEVYGLGRGKIIFQIILPSALTSILTGLRLGIGGAWASVVAAEMIGATSGIGYMIMFAKSLAQAANMYVLVLVIGLIGFFVDRILLAVQNRVRARFSGNGQKAGG